MKEYSIESIIYCFDEDAAVKGGRMLTMTKWSGAEPVFDIRDWNWEDGKLVPDEGITFDKESALTLCHELERYFHGTTLEGMNFRKEGMQHE